MKRTLSIILALILILAAVPALADQDPIVGFWYITNSYGGSQIVSAYVFDASGNIYAMAFDIEPSGFDTKNSVNPIQIGNWLKVRTGVYSFRTIYQYAAAKDYLYLDGDLLYIAGSDSYGRYHRMDGNGSDFISPSAMEAIKQKY